MKRELAGLILLLSLGAGIKAQMGRIVMPIEIGISQHLGQPFTDTEVTTLTQTLGDGTKITRTAQDRIARDSKGRTYKEQHLPWTQDSKNPVYYVNLRPSGKRFPITAYESTSKDYSSENSHNPFTINEHVGGYFHGSL